MDFFRTRRWDIVGKRWLWFGLSALVMLTGAAFWTVRGLNFGIDFTGGGILRYEFAGQVARSSAEEVQVLARVRELLAKEKLTAAKVLLSEGTQLLLRTPQTASDQEAAAQAERLRADLAKAFPEAAPVTLIGRERVGPVIGRELSNAALEALILGMVLILIYVTIRYEFRFAVAAIVALFHDAFVLTSAMAITHMELDVTFVPALLTVIGYSINDTIIIFDRVRENMRIHKRAPFKEITNVSLLQTMRRSINTTVSTLFPLVALFLMGGPTVHAFSFAMIVGIVTGCYSSIFTASPLVVLWREISERRAGTPTAASRAADELAREAREGGKAPEADVEQPVAATAGAGPEGTSGRLEAAAEAAEQEAREKRRARRKARKTKRSGKSSKRKKRF